MPTTEELHDLIASLHDAVTTKRPVWRDLILGVAPALIMGLVGAFVYINDSVKLAGPEIKSLSVKVEKNEARNDRQDATIADIRVICERLSATSENMLEMMRDTRRNATLP